MSDYDFEIEQLMFAIDHEHLMRNNLEKENDTIKKTIDDLEEELSSERNDPNDSEWGRKFLTQQEVNIELRKQIVLMKEKMKQLAEIEPDEADPSHPSSLNDTDLKNLLKQLDKEKRVLEGTLKDLEWRLDAESQDFFRLNEEKEKYKLDLNQAMSIVDDAKLKSRSSSIPVSPVPGIKFNSKNFKTNIKNRNYGIPDNHRILDARKGPVKKTAAVKMLPKLEQTTPLSADSALASIKKEKPQNTTAHDMEPKDLNVPKTQ